MQNCPPFGTYSFLNVAFTVDGALVQGFSEGDDVIVIEPGSDVATPQKGADGASILSISADRSVNVRVKLMQNSPFNAYFDNIVSRMRSGALTGLTFAIGFTDLSTRESGGCTNAGITKRSTISKGMNATEREWEFYCPCWEPGFVTVNGA